MIKILSSDIKKYYFSITVAKELGVDESFMFCNIFFWVLKNQSESDEDHYHDGTWWMYNSVRAFVEQFPFWTTAKVKRILRNLENAGYIKTGRFNHFGPDKTKWYAITQKGMEIVGYGQSSVQN
jgi:hypothetical protein